MIFNVLKTYVFKKSISDGSCEEDINIAYQVYRIKCKSGSEIMNDSIELLFNNVAISIPINNVFDEENESTFLSSHGDLSF